MYVGTAEDIRVIAGRVEAAVMALCVYVDATENYPTEARRVIADMQTLAIQAREDAQSFLDEIKESETEVEVDTEPTPHPDADVLEYLLKSPNRAMLMQAVDAQIAAKKHSPDLYVVPSEYECVSPLINKYWDNLSGLFYFYRYLLAHFPKRSPESMEMREVYRRIASRFDAQIRRDREARGLAACIENYGADDVAGYEAVYKQALTAHWAERRKKYLTSARRDNGGVLSDSEQFNVLLDFWDEIDSEISEGSVPHPDELIDDYYT